MHALFASLARSLQLPVRLVLGRELEPLAGMQRWWAEFQALGIGWVPVDVYSGADLTSRERPRLFGRLDALRMSLAVGREAKLAPKPAAASISGFVDLYAEVDGKPHGSYRSTFVAAPARSKDP
jgi:transglutaminase-like putative cysteine protease